MTKTIYTILSLTLFLNFVYASDSYEISFNSSPNGIGELTFTINDYQISSIIKNGTTYSDIIFDGNLLSNKKGFAQLPFLSSAVVLPDDKNVDIILAEKEFTEISLEYPLLPSRGILYRNQDISSIPYSIDPNSITDNWYPENLTHISEPYIIKDVRGASIFVNPFQYNAQKNTLRVYTKLKVKIVENSSAPSNPFNRISNRIVREMNGIYQSVFINYSDLQENLTIGSYGDLLVISTARDTAAIRPLINWKREKGFNVFTETVSTGTNVKSLIQQKYNMNNNILYVLVVGDWADIKSDIGTSQSAPMDPEMGCVVGTDNFPDITIGRISANSPAHVTIQVNKIINYETNPDTSGNWLKTATGIASMEGSGIGDDGEIDYVHNDVIWNNKLSPFTFDTYNPVYEPSATKQMIFNALSNGTSLINYTGHGSATSWGTTGFNTSDVGTLQNGDKLPWIISVACNNGNFHQTSGDCFGEKWVKQHGGGAVMILAASISQPWTPPMRGQDYFMDLLIGGYDYTQYSGQSGISTTEQRTTIGSIVFNGFVLMYTEANGSDDLETIQTWNLFGDPSMQVRTDIPAPLMSSLNAAFVGAPFTTTVTASGPVEGAMVTLSQNNQYYTSITDASGQVTINHTLMPGTAKLVITSFNTETIYEDITVVPATGPYLYVLNPVVDDANTNNNGVAECGETIDLNLKVTNLGIDVASNITGTISCSDTMLSIINGTSSISSVGVSDTVIGGSFSVNINPNAPHLHRCTINLNLTADSAGVPNGFSWDQTLFLEIREGSKISLIKPSLNFPNTCLTYTSTTQMPINNIGPDTLKISDISSDLPQFTSNLSSLVVAPGATSNIEISFTPDSTLIFDGTITLLNNDPVNFVHTFPVAGTGIYAAAISIVDTIRQNANPTDSLVVPVTITNTGLGELEFSAQISGFDPNNPVFVSEEGGSDNFGHMWIDSDMPNGPEFNWIDITSTGMQIPITGSNAISDTIDLGLTFNFYGQEYHKVRACTNGWLSFTSYTVAYNNFALPSAVAPRSMIAGLWDNLNFKTDSKLYFENMGNRSVFLYENIYTVFDQGPYTFEIIIYDNENIVIQYLSLDSLANSYTVGIQNFNGDDGLTIAHNESYLHDSLAVMISRVIWASVSPMNGTISAGGSQDLNLTILTSDFALGNYWASLHINSNDPANEHLIIPIKLSVDLFGGMEEEGLYTVEGFHLYQNKPNPFNPTTTITYNLPNSADVELVIYNMLGQKVKTLVNTNQKAKLHHVVWDGTDDHGVSVASGLYIYRLKTAEHTAVNKMVFMK